MSKINELTESLLVKNSPLSPYTNSDIYNRVTGEVPRKAFNLEFKGTLQSLTEKLAEAVVLNERLQNLRGDVFGNKSKKQKFSFSYANVSL